MSYIGPAMPEHVEPGSFWCISAKYSTFADYLNATRGNKMDREYNGSNNKATWLIKYYLTDYEKIGKPMREIMEALPEAKRADVFKATLQGDPRFLNPEPWCSLYRDLLVWLLEFVDWESVVDSIMAE